jgi:Xaa-Pro aminopeptidase
VGLKTHGTMAVDWENRIDFDRLRRERLQKARDLLAQSSMGSLLCFDMNNVRYLTSTHIGTWAQDKANRFTLLPQNDEPILWDFGSAAKHHQLNCPWLGDRSRPGISMLRGAMTPEMGRAEDVAKKIRIELEMRGLHKEPVGIDIIELPVLFALQREGIEVVDGQQLMSEARVIKTQDEISLLNTSAMMVDAAYDELYRAMKPGLRENEAVGLVSKVLYDLGSEYVEAVNAISGERCNPHPHVFSDRVLRPGDPVYYDILHSYMGYRTCYYRCFTVGFASQAMVDAYKRCRDYLDAAIELVRPGRTTRRYGRRRKISVSPTKKRPSPCNTATASGWRSGRSPSSAVWFHSSIPSKSSPAWCLPWKPSGLRRTVGARRASKRKSWSHRLDTRSSRASPRNNFWSRARITTR